MTIPWLRLLLICLWVGCVAGAAVVAGLSLGHVSLATFVWAAGIGLVIGIPAAVLNWAWLRPRRARQAGIVLPFGRG